MSWRSDDKRYGHLTSDDKEIYLRYMTTQVLFRVDPRVKEKAVQRARREGVPLGVVLKFATNAYANGELHLAVTSTSEIPNAKTARLLAEIDRDIKAGRNLSPIFDDADSAIAYLRTATKKHQEK